MKKYGRSDRVHCKYDNKISCADKKFDDGLENTHRKTPYSGLEMTMCCTHKACTRGTSLQYPITDHRFTISTVDGLITNTPGKPRI